MVDTINKSKSVTWKLLSHTGDDRPAWTGFSTLLKKYLTGSLQKNTSGGCMKHHIFEFHNGIPSIPHRVCENVIYTHDYPWFAVDRTYLVNQLLVELLGTGKTSHSAVLSDIQLPRAPIRTLTDDKIAYIGTIMRTSFQWKLVITTQSWQQKKQKRKWGNR